MRPIAVSPPSTRRRAKLSGRRTKKGTLVGFHGRASGTITEIPDCLLLSPALLASLPALHAITALAASRKGEVALTVTESATGTDVLIQTDMALTDALRVTLPGVGRAHGLARITWNDETVATLEPPYQTLGLARVVPPPGAFLQATKAGEAALLAAVEDATQGARRIVDLFSGCGTFSLPLSKRAEVHAVEGDAAMITALDRGWRTATGLKRVTSQARDLFRRPLEPDELRGFDAAVIDPPRAGAEAQTATLARSGVRQIAMVSCNPVTFARDAATLVAGGYRLDWVQVVDQFRWSAHIEAVAAFTMA
jgi:23S rRNA (uracil1939-C5)-methyltransferase